MGDLHKREGVVDKESVFGGGSAFKRGGLFGLLWRITLLWKRITTKQLEYAALIINDLKKKRVWIFERA